MMEVRAKKALGQHFLTDLKIAESIVSSLHLPGCGEKYISEGEDWPSQTLEIGPGMGEAARARYEKASAQA